MHLRIHAVKAVTRLLILCSFHLPSIARTVEQLGMQLRIAAERGKVREVKRLLEAGAKLTRDSVSGTESAVYGQFLKAY